MLSVVIPTYNEAQNILLLIEKIKKVLVNVCPFEIIVVDDNSPDNTWKIVEELSIEDSQVTCYRRQNERGLSSAVIAGFELAKGRYFAVLDADMQHDERLLVKMLEDIKKNDLVIGSRKVDGGGIESWNWFRRFLSWGATKMAHWFLQVPINDPMSGFFMVQRKAFEKVSSKINPRGFKILLEILFHLKSDDVLELGYVFKPRQYGESKLSQKVIIDYIAALYELRFGGMLPVDFMKYGAVGLSGVLVNLFVLTLASSYGASDQIALISAIVVSMCSNFYFNNRWTFSNRRKRGIKSFLAGLLKFNLVCSLGALINYAVAMFLRSEFQAHLTLAGIAGILLATIWNYLVNKNIVWGDK